MEVRTQEEYDRALQLKSEKGDFWIGGHDIVDEGVWIWNSTGEEINMDRFWRNGQPDNYIFDEHCLQMTGIGLNDQSCANIFPFVCETV